MRRFVILAATAALSAGLVAGATDTASAARRPAPFASTSATLGLNETQDRCVLTVSWEPSQPERVASYLVQANNAPLKGKNTVQGNTQQETSTRWEFADDTPFYVNVTINYTDGRSSKPFSVGNASWSCLD